MVQVIVLGLSVGQHDDVGDPIIIDLQSTEQSDLFVYLLPLSVTPIGRDLLVGLGFVEPRLVNPRDTLVSSVAPDVVPCPSDHHQHGSQRKSSLSTQTLQFIKAFRNALDDLLETLAPEQFAPVILTKFS